MTDDMVVFPRVTLPATAAVIPHEFHYPTSTQPCVLRHYAPLDRTIITIRLDDTLEDSMARIMVNGKLWFAHHHTADAEVSGDKTTSTLSVVIRPCMVNRPILLEVLDLYTDLEFPEIPALLRSARHAVTNDLDIPNNVERWRLWAAEVVSDSAGDLLLRQVALQILTLIDEL